MPKFNLKNRYVYYIELDDDASDKLKIEHQQVELTESCLITGITIKSTLESSQKIYKRAQRLFKVLSIRIFNTGSVRSRDRKLAIYES